MCIFCVEGVLNEPTDERVEQSQGCLGWGVSLSARPRRWRGRSRPDDRKRRRCLRRRRQWKHTAKAVSHRRGHPDGRQHALAGLVEQRQHLAAVAAASGGQASHTLVLVVTAALADCLRCRGELYEAGARDGRRRLDRAGGDSRVDLMSARKGAVIARQRKYKAKAVSHRRLHPDRCQERGAGGLHRDQSDGAGRAAGRREPKDPQAQTDGSQRHRTVIS